MLLGFVPFGIVAVVARISVHFVLIMWRQLRSRVAFAGAADGDDDNSDGEKSDPFHVRRRLVIAVAMPSSEIRGP